MLRRVCMRGRTLCRVAACHPSPKVDVFQRSLHVQKYSVPAGELQTVPVRLFKHFLQFAERAESSRAEGFVLLAVKRRPRSQTCPAVGAPVSGHIPETCLYSDMGLEGGLGTCGCSLLIHVLGLKILPKWLCRCPSSLVSTPGSLCQASTPWL